MKPAQVLGAALLAVGLAACAPEANWREFNAEGSGVAAMFPCRPDHHARPVRMAEAQVRMEMLVCAAGGATFALSFVDLTNPAMVSVAIDEWRATALANIGGVKLSSEPARVSGMTPNAQATRLTISGRLPDGAAVQEQAAFFVKGLRVFQASVIGARLLPEMTETFFAGLKLPS